MAKFGKLVPNKVPWDVKVNEITDQIITIHSLEPTDTHYGPCFLGTVDLSEPVNLFSSDVRFLFSGSVIVDQLNKLLLALEETGEEFPVDVSIEKVKGKNYAYYQLVDPEGETDE
jgi:hypothetical protein